MQARTAVEMLARRVATTPAAIATLSKRSGEWRTGTWQDLGERTAAIAAGLGALGLDAGDRVGILAATREEWADADLGILRAGGTTVPIYPSNTADECAFILEDSGARFVFAEGPAQLDKLRRERARLARVEGVILVDGEAADPWVLPLADLVARGHALRDRDPEWLARRAATVTPETVMTLVYTSGTTGRPKGVVLTHANFAAECDAVGQIVDLDTADVQLLFLPLAHIFARLMLHVAVHGGSAIAFAESVEKLLDNIRDVRPTWMASVPRVYEKVYAKARSDAQRGGTLHVRTFDWALSVGREVSRRRQRGRPPGALLGLKYGLARRLVFGKLKARFGGRLRFFISGGAPLNHTLGEFFHAADLLILEGYGLTETTAATHVNRLDKYRFGTVGLPLPGVETKIAEDGEVLVRGPNVMREYWRREDDTREVLSPDGWFATGDMGEVDADGFLRITDRKKDLIVTAGGKNVAPQNIEGLLVQSPYVSQVMVHGDRRKFLSAVVTLNEVNVKQYLTSHGRESTGPLYEDEEVKKLIEGDIHRLNQQLGQHESIKKFIIAPKDFEVGKELTPTLKIRRKVVNEMYKVQLDALYPRDADLG